MFAFKRLVQPRWSPSIWLARACGADLREDYEGTSLDAIRQMVSLGMGMSLFPELYALSEFEGEDNVVLRRIEGWAMKREICLAWRRDSARNAHFRQLAESAMASAGKLFTEQ